MITINSLRYVQAHLESSMSEQVGTEPTSFSSERFRAMEPGQKEDIVGMNYVHILAPERLGTHHL